MTWLVAPENDYRSLLDQPPVEPFLRVSVVIPVYNRVELLSKTLAALVPQTYPAHLLSVVVADDGSHEDVGAALAPFADHLDLTLVRRERDGYGAGQARNLGARTSGAELLVFVDADCLPDPELVDRHAAWHHHADNLVVIGSRHHLDTSQLDDRTLAGAEIPLREEAFGTEEPSIEDLRSPDFRLILHRRTADLRAGGEAYRSLVSSNFSIRRDRFLEVGGFSEDFHRWGGEDTELGWRLFQGGLYFVAEDQALVYHQWQVDAGPAGWRTRSRSHNQGIIVNKIPHRFYRTSQPGHIYEIPKVSWVVAPTVGERAEELWEQLLRQSFTDWEALFLDDGGPVTALAEANSADPRLRLVTWPERDRTSAALRAARGEYVALLHGAASLDHRLLGRALKHLEERPRLGHLSVAYQVPTTAGTEVYRTLEDVSHLDLAWGVRGLPVFALVRRREWVKAFQQHEDAPAAWEMVRSLVRSDHLTDPLVALPASHPRDRLPAEFPPPVADRTLFLTDLRRGPARALRATARYALTRVTGRPYRQAVKPQPPAPDPDAAGPPRARYVGWNGHDNLGDEALLVAVRELMPWADIATSGPAPDLLLLGGGTLINRGYLRQLHQMDSPRIERAVFGTGVANPEYWGEPREKPADWLEWLSTCCYVGVRGPISRQLLKEWGYRGRLEVVGDPALAISPPDDLPDRRHERVVISPAYARGLLWGESDEAVFGVLADAIKSLRADGREVWLLSCFPADDRHLISIMRAAGEPDLPYLAGYADVDEALRVLASAGLVVGERLHAAVLAAAMGTPFVALEYRPKVRDFARSVDQERFVLRTDQLEAAALLERIRAAEADRTAVTESLAVKVAHYRARLTAAADEIRSALG